MTRFVDFDLDNNGPFAASGVVLAQGGTCVPWTIEGFIFAQAAELWAIWREHCVFATDHKEATIEGWQ